jgi:hypothetical protein
MSQPKKKLFKALNKLVVECENKDKGCEAQIPLKDYDEHIQKACGFEEVMCPNFGCEKEMLRQEYAKHLENECSHRILKCERCFTMMKKG